MEFIYFPVFYLFNFNQWNASLLAMKENIKGKGSVGIAIAYYSLRGMVAIPLEPCDYNLIFEKAGNLMRIKVISCSFKTSYGVYSASIKTSGGNQPNSQVKKFDETSCEMVFVVTPELDMYEIPSKEIQSSRQISLKVYERYQVNLIPG
jgi:PD-(D/E)XK endonuclease